MKNVKIASAAQYRIVILAMVVCIISGCSVAPSNKRIPSTSAMQPSVSQTGNDRDENALFAVFNQWRGVPYQLGGRSKDGIDCSAFVQIAFRDAWQQVLPRTTASQSKLGAQVRYRQAQYGDLVFFKTAPDTRHVGVYIGNQRFMHASTSQGVVISRLDNPYWASTLWQFRRIQAKPLVN